MAYITALRHRKESNSHCDHKRRHRGHNRRSGTVKINILQGSSRLVSRRGSGVDGTVPTVGLEALGAGLGNIGVGSIKGAAQNRTAHAGRPVAVTGSIAHGHGVISVFDEEISPAVVV